jgi:prophage antirepressor-like protein
MNELKVFNFEDDEVKVQLIDDDPWFVGNDVSRTLGYSNYRNAVSMHVDDEDKLRTQIEYAGQNREVTLINESGLYNLIFNSKLESAKRFKKWVTSEVLPTIRKTGTYQIPKDPMDALRLMFQATEQTQEKVNQVDARVIYLEQNVKLEPGEYTYIGKSISRKVYQIGKERAYSMNRQQKDELFKAINKEIAEITGVRTRTQLRQKDYKKVIEFIDDWEPSKATSMLVKNYEQMEMEV